MGKNGSVIVLFIVFVIVFGPSDAFNSRKLVTISDPNQDSGLSSPPPPPGKTPDLASVGAPKPKDELIENASDSESKRLNGTYTKEGSENSGDKKVDTGKNQDGNGLKAFVSESCKRNPICSDQSKTMMACVQDSENGPNNLTLIVQNEQDVDLKVKITSGTSMNNHLQTFGLPAHATEKVNITLSGDKNNKVILNAGNGDCELQFSQPSAVNSVNNPAKPKDVDNPADTPPKPKDVDNPADTPPKPKDVDNPADTPAKPKDVDNPANTPAKPKDIDNPADTPAKPKGADNPTDTLAKPKDVNNPADNPTKPKDVDHPTKPENENDPLKSKDVNPPPKSKDGDVLSKAKETDDQSKSKEADDPTKSKSKSKDVDEQSKPTMINVNAPVPKNNVFDQLTFYSKQVTPIHGAYLAFLVALVIGGSWALCSIRKRRTGGGVPYQELEMGPSESSNAVDVETAEGWDQDWDDDDWDEDKAIRSPGGSNHVKTISSNGLTSRATKKDDWDANWDD